MRRARRGHASRAGCGTGARCSGHRRPGAAGWLTRARLPPGVVSLGAASQFPRTPSSAQRATGSRLAQPAHGRAMESSGTISGGSRGPSRAAAGPSAGRAPHGRAGALADAA
eukprot:15437225-Alexandrium_andersonii.AAC.1